MLTPSSPPTCLPPLLTHLGQSVCRSFSSSMVPDPSRLHVTALPPVCHLLRHAWLLTGLSSTRGTAISASARPSADARSRQPANATTCSARNSSCPHSASAPAAMGQLASVLCGANFTGDGVLSTCSRHGMGHAENEEVGDVLQPA